MSDYRALTIGEKAPHFQATTTFGQVNFPEDYRGKWVVFFSHPGDFTPVCTTEIMTFASMAGAFAANGTALLGLSVDSNQSHIDWSRAMERYSWNGINRPRIPFPIVADDMGEAARLYGMLMPSSSATRTVRSVFVIDPEGTVRAVLAYPLTTGRNIREILRLVMALQAHDRTGNMTPAHWVPGDPMLLPAPSTLPLASQRAENASGAHCLDWYLCFTQGENANNAGAMNVPNIPNNPSVPNVPNIPNVPNVPNNPNVSNIPNVPNVLNNPNVPNVSNVSNIPNVPNNLNIPNASGVAGMVRPAAPAQPVPAMPAAEKPKQPAQNLLPNLMPPAQTFPAPPVQPIVIAPAPRPQPPQKPAPNALPVPTPYGIPAAPGATLPAGMPAAPSAGWMPAKPQAKAGAEKNRSLSMDEIMKMLEEVGLAGDLPKLDGTAANGAANPGAKTEAKAPSAVPVLPLRPAAQAPAQQAAPTQQPKRAPESKEAPAANGGIMEQNRMLFGMGSKEPEEHMITRDYPYKKR